MARVRSSEASEEYKGKDRVAKVPKTITPIKGSGGTPSAAKNTAHKAGTIKINLPAGLSQRKRRIIVIQVGSRSGWDIVIISRKK